MAKWNAAITAAGQAGIEGGGGLPQGGPSSVNFADGHSGSVCNNGSH